MERNAHVRGGLIQASSPATDPLMSIQDIKDAAMAKHLPLIEEAGRRGVQMLCLQELFSTPYFCPSQDPRWYAAAEEVPGPTVEALQPLARKYEMVIVVPVYEQEMRGVYYNTAAVIDADGALPRQVPQAAHPADRGVLGEVLLQARQPGLPGVRDAATGKVGVYICYDRHFPEGARLLGLNGAEIVFNPSATVAGLSQYLWKLEQPAHAVANGYFMGCINRVGTEPPWNIGKFYGTSYFVNPRGEFLADGERGRGRPGGRRPRPR